MTALFDSDIKLKEEKVNRDPVSLFNTFNLAIREINKYINNLRDHVKSLAVPETQVTQDDIITAINSMRKVRVIDTTLIDGVSAEFDDGELLTRSGNTFIVSHPYATDNVMFRLDDAGTALTNITTSGNQIVVEFDVIPSTTPKLIIL